MTAYSLDLMLDTELPAARRGSHDAYARIVRACQNTVTAIALAITRDVQASEDIAQDAFLKAWQQLDRLKNNASFLPWLRQITRNLAHDWLRAQAQRPLSGDAADIVIGMAADPGPGPDDRLLRSEAQAVADELIAALPEDARETLLLYYREGQNSRQVAGLLGLSDEAVRKRLSRARADIRAELLQRFGTFAQASAPSAAFASAVAGMLTGIAPMSSAAAGIGGAIAGSGAIGGIAGASAGLLIDGNPQSALAGAMAGMLVGMIGHAVTWRYLRRFRQMPEQAAQLRRFLRLTSATGAGWLLCLMLATAFTRGWMALLGIAVIGLALIQYQYLRLLPEIMAPILAHPDNAPLRRGGVDYVVGRKGVWLASVIALAAILFAMVRAGRFA